MILLLEAIIILEETALKIRRENAVHALRARAGAGEYFTGDEHRTAADSAAAHPAWLIHRSSGSKA
jgi:hypothetical protein